jgi:WD40 repeat protein
VNSVVFSTRRKEGRIGIMRTGLCGCGMLRREELFGSALVGHRGEVISIVFSPDGKMVASGSMGQHCEAMGCREGRSDWIRS